MEEARARMFAIVFYWCVLVGACQAAKPLVPSAHGEGGCVGATGGAPGVVEGGGLVSKGQ